MPPPDLAAIRQHALEQRDLCRSQNGAYAHVGADPLVALWTAIHDAATALNPDHHPMIKKGPQWTSSSPATTSTSPDQDPCKPATPTAPSA